MASQQAYDDRQFSLPRSETVKGVLIWRVWTSRFGRQRLFGRALDYLTFYVSAASRLMRCVGPGDIVVAKTDPPLISVIATGVARLRGAVLINWIQDVFPEVATAIGIRGIAPVEPILRALRNFSMRTARYNVVLGLRMAERISAQGIPDDKISVIHNWSDEALITPIDGNSNHLRQEWGLEGKFVVEYSGNMGRAHEFTTIIDAATLLKKRSDIRFVFIGGGAKADYIVEEIAQRKLSNFDFKPYQPRDQLVYSLGAADLHLISLLPALEGLIVPSKFYGIAATGRPTLYVGDPRGEIPAILVQADCGHTVQPGEAAALADYIVTLADDRPKAIRLGKNARALFEREFSKTRAFAKWQALINTIK